MILVVVVVVVVAGGRSESTCGPAVVDRHDLVGGSDHVCVDGSLNRFLKFR